MGLFNHWVAGTWLEPLENRDVVAIARAMLHGTAVLTRAERLNSYGVVGLPSLAELSRPADPTLLAQM